MTPGNWAAQLDLFLGYSTETPLTAFTRSFNCRDVTVAINVSIRTREVDRWRGRRKVLAWLPKRACQ